MYDGNLTADLAEEDLAMIQELEQKIIDGEITVSSALGMDSAEFEQVRNAVKP